MKRILYLLIFLFSISAFKAEAQAPQAPQTLSTWYQYKRFGTDSLFNIPQDTLPPPVAYRKKAYVASKNQQLYLWDTAALYYKPVGLEKHFANTDLTATDNRYHNFRNNDLFIDSVYGFGVVKHGSTYTLSLLLNLSGIELKHLNNSGSYSRLQLTDGISRLETTLSNAYASVGTTNGVARFGASNTSNFHGQSIIGYKDSIVFDVNRENGIALNQFVWKIRSLQNKASISAGDSLFVKDVNDFVYSVPLSAILSGASGIDTIYNEDNKLKYQKDGVTHIVAEPVTNVFSDGTTINLDRTIAESWKGTIAGNRSFTLSNIPSGKFLIIDITQDATAGRAPTFTNTILWRDGTPPVWPTVGGRTTTIVIHNNNSVLKGTWGTYY